MDRHNSDQLVFSEPDPSPFPAKFAVTILVIAILLVGIIVGAYRIIHTTKTGPKVAQEISEPAVNTPAQVAITNNGFVPASISVAKGQAVVWVNNASQNFVISSDPYPKDNTLASLNSGDIIAPGSAYSYIFTSAGRFSYHDNLQPLIDGTVIVK